MQVFYVNIGGGEPTVRPDFWELLDYAVAHHVGVKFSTNGFRITPERAARLAATDYVDVQISLDGATAEVNDAVRGPGTYDAALARHGQPPGRRHEGLQALGRLHPSQHRPARRVQGHRRQVRRPAAADPAAPVGPRRRRLGRAAPAARTSSASSTTGWSPTATRSSPATRSSTCRPTARHCPVSTCAARAGSSAWSTRSATSTRARSPSTTSSWPATCARTAASTRSGRPRRCSLDLRSPADRRRLHAVLGVRLVPRRLHGRQVLHRPAARRAGPGVREGQQRVGAGR